MSGPRPRLTAVDLFCGAGGLSQGLHDAGFELIVAADHDPDTCATHSLNSPGTTMVGGDLTARENRAAVIEAVGSTAARLAGRRPAMPGVQPDA